MKKRIFAMLLCFVLTLSFFSNLSHAFNNQENKIVPFGSAVEAVRTKTVIQRSLVGGDYFWKTIDQYPPEYEYQTLVAPSGYHYEEDYTKDIPGEPYMTLLGVYERKLVTIYYYKLVKD